MEGSSLQNTHVKLLGFDLLSLKPSPMNSSTFYLNRNPVSRVEILGVITSRDQKPNKFIKFTVDDGTAAVTCILWLNQLSSPYFSSRQPATVRVLADLAKGMAADVQIGKVGRVRGRITSYRGELQVTVSDVVIERDPNAETLHWMDCLTLARRCYGG
ncbi:Nucleic acid binding, tRNA/helicase-type [Corchorus capsularis]|uniref:CST complex subunit STN1 n=1 Tax=Corchorus capsularis TaxID=210143 RepID=A0A1R3H826_COCAP|nr:Nucleic acid binding, tRNA/helicase-type [Corchorus capsularis]